MRILKNYKGNYWKTYKYRRETKATIQTAENQGKVKENKIHGTTENHGTTESPGASIRMQARTEERTRKRIRRGPKRQKDIASSGRSPDSTISAASGISYPNQARIIYRIWEDIARSLPIATI